MQGHMLKHPSGDPECPSHETKRTLYSFPGPGSKDIIIGRAGVSPPSRTTSIIFLYIYINIYIFISVSYVVP